MWWPAIGLCYGGALGSCLFNKVSFLSYFLTLTPSVNDFAELPAILVSELDYRADIHFQRVYIIAKSQLRHCVQCNWNLRHPTDFVGMPQIYSQRIWHARTHALTKVHSI